MQNPMYRDRKMWFGVRGHMEWIRASAADQDFADVGWESQLQYLSGQSSVRSSVGSHKEYSLLWNTLSRDEARRITDYAAGVHDVSQSVNLIYFLDPMAMDRNVAPMIWAAPFSSLADGTTLVPGQAPVSSVTPSNTLGYPARSVTYTANRVSSSFYVPIPPGFTVWVGFHGSRTGTAGIQITPSNGFTDGAPVTATVLSVSDTTRVADSFSSADWDGVTISLNMVNPGSSNTCTISGLVVQVLPTGTTPEAGGYISGQGNSGCQFLGKPLVTPRSAALDQVGLSATLVETGTAL